MRAVAMAMLCALGALVACEYREVVGRQGEPTEQGGSADASNPAIDCDGGRCVPETSGDCSDFQAPSSDCTAGQPSCDFDQDCEAIGGRCNLAIRRCFRDDSVCVGTMCDFNDDCPATERCNMAAHACYDPNASQACMPCFLADSDCGLGQCDHEAGQCI